jgi:hypothetical protein
MTVLFAEETGVYGKQEFGYITLLYLECVFFIGVVILAGYFSRKIVKFSRYRSEQALGDPVD